MTRSKKRTPPVIDPYLPKNGNFGYRVSRYELDLEYKVSSNRLTGTAANRICSRLDSWKL